MKKNILIVLFFSFNYFLNAQGKYVYVIIDKEYQKLFKFNIEYSEENDFYFSSMKILKYNTKHKGFEKDKKNLNQKDIVVVTKQPTETNFYEFQSYKKPKEIKNINSLELYSIEDISKNIKSIRDIWIDSNCSIVFVKKSNCNYKLWKMKPTYLE